MKQITLQQLHEETARWVKEAAGNGGIVVTVDGKPAVALTQFPAAHQGKPLPNRWEKIRQTPFISVDSGDLISQDRDRS